LPAEGQHETESAIAGPLPHLPEIPNHVQQPPVPTAYVLHSRAYRETSALVDFLTPQVGCGRYCAVRGARRTWRGRSCRWKWSFVAWRAEERRAHGKRRHRAWLNGDALFSGLYLNELLMRLLPAEDPHPAVFDHYAATLLALAEGRPLEPLLRSFEWRLLDDLGYGFSLTRHPRRPYRADGLYRLQVDAGPERVDLLQPGCSTAPNCWPWPKPTGPPRRLVGGQAPDAPGPGRSFGRPALVSRELFRKP
jgi:DNA repair protein RecO (recombination protein O)